MQNFRKLEEVFIFKIEVDISLNELVNWEIYTNIT